MAKQPGRMVTYFEGLLTIKSHGTLVLQIHVTNESHCITTNRLSIAAKLYRMRKYPGQFLTVKTSYALITWSCKVKRQTRIIIYSQPTRVSMDTNLAE